jgi:DNA-binding transcriptional ArsR family regulator
MTTSHRNLDPNYENLSNRLKLLAHPERLRILDAIRRDAECVCHLEALLEKPQPYVSQQLRLLRDAGLIEHRKQGQNVYYGLRDDDVRVWLNAVLGPVDPELSPLARHQRVVACSCPNCNEETEVIKVLYERDYSGIERLIEESNRTQR